MENFPQSITHLHVSDPELLVEGMRGAHLLPCQLSKKPLPSDLHRIMLPSLCLDVIRLGPAMLFTGTTSPDCYTIVYVIACPEPGHSFNFSLTHHHGYLAFFPPGAALDARTPENYENASLTIAAKRFLEAASVHYPDMPDKLLQNGAGMRLPPREDASLRRLLLDLQSTATASSVGESQSLNQALEDQLLTTFFSALRQGSGHLVPTPRRQVAKIERRLRQVRDYIRSREGSHKPMEDICADLQISMRTLENHFQEYLGISPHTFWRHHRLHEARRTLLSHPDSAAGLVKQVALQQGFWHLGRFAQYYRTLFGESPHKTLHRR